MSEFWKYLGNTVIRPRSTFMRLNADPKGLQQGAQAILFIGVLYTLTVGGLSLAGAHISAPPWLAIPAEDYYFWEIFFALPVFLLDWILAAGLIQLLSHGFHGQGSFEKTLAATGFALTMPSFVTWIPETVGTILFLTGTMTQKEWLEIISRPGFWQVFATLYQIVAVGWMLLLVPLAVAVVQRIRWWQAILTGIITLGIFMTLMLVFIR
jgi:hypothetical protein